MSIPALDGGPRRLPAFVREKLKRAAAAISRGEHAAALDHLQAAVSGAGDGLSVLVLYWRGRALDALERYPVAAGEFEAAGRLAESFGWLRGASSSLGRAGRSFCPAGPKFDLVVNRYVVGQQLLRIEEHEHTLAIYRRDSGGASARTAITGSEKA